VTIRRRRNDDAPALFELVNEDGFQRTAALRGPFASCEEFTSWLDGLASRKIEITGSVDGAVAGFGGLYVLEGRLDHSCWIWLGVREKSRQRGIGAALLQTLIAAADVLAGMRRIQLTVFADNETAIRLYGKFGFEIEGRHRRFLRRGDQFLDAFTMARLLAGAPLTNAERLQEIQRLKPLWSAA
jgi:putative acetyltransferase